MCNCLPGILLQVNEVNMKIKDERIHFKKINTNRLMWDTIASIFL